MPIGHIGVNVSDLKGAKAYFDRLMPLLSFEPFVESEGQFSYRPTGETPGTMIFFYAALESATYSRHEPGLQHLAFIVKSRALVHQVHDWVQAQKNEIIHEPREFPEYHHGYYATFWYGPERFMLEAVCHKDPASE
jgi:catechol 2,3-dioxygenase-like lactoylglutathione lyase family enzyme